MTTRQQWAQDFLLNISRPVSSVNLESVVVWVTSENTKAENNPLATTMPWADATDFNSDGVKNYATYEDGIAATKATIYNGNYAAILDCFERSASPAETCSTIENSVWGSKPSSALVAEVLQDYGYYASLDIDSNNNPTPPSEPVLSIGSEGEAVVELQSFFNKDCNQHLATDGIFGEYTLLAVRNFQRYMKLEVDGIVGPVTWEAVRYVEELHGE